MAEVMKLNAALSLVDQVSPGVKQIESALTSLEGALGVTRAQVESNRRQMEEYVAAGQLVDMSLDKLGITTEEYAKVLEQQEQAAEEAAVAMDRLHDEANQIAAAMPRAGDGARQLSAGLDHAAGAAFKVGGALTAMTAAASLFVGKSTMLAMEAVESENLFEVSFEGMADDARAWSENMSASLGVNAFEMRKSSGMIFVMADSMGLTKDAAYEMATGMTELSQDMASFYNIDAEEAMSKLRAGITGEAESLKRLGILVNEQTVKDAAYRLGIAKTGMALTNVQKVEARWATIREQTIKSQGDLARTMDSPVNQMRIMKESITAVQIELGMALMPVMQSFISFSSTQLVPLLQDAVKWFTELSPWMQKVIIGFGGLALAAGPAILALGGLMTTISSLVSVYGIYSTSAIAAKVATAGLTPTIWASVTAWLAKAAAVIAANAAMALSVGAIAAVGVGVFKLTSYWAESTPSGQAFVGVIADIVQWTKELFGAQSLAELQMDRTTDAVKDNAEWFGRMRAEQEGIDYDEMIANNTAAAHAFTAFVGPVQEVTESLEDMNARIDKQLKEAKEAKMIDKAKKLLGLLKTDELSLAEATVALERAGVTIEGTAPKLSKAEQAAKKLKEEIQALQDEFSGAKLQAEMDKLGVALEPLISKGEITGVQMEKLGKKLMDAHKAGVTLNPQLEKLRKEFELIQIVSEKIEPPDFGDVTLPDGLGDGLNISDMLGQAAWDDMAASAHAAGMSVDDITMALESAGASATAAALAVKPIEDEISASEVAAAKFDAQMQAVTEGLLILGDALGGTFGDLSGMLSSSIQGFTQMADKVRDNNAAVADGSMSQAAADAEKLQMQIGLVANAAGMLGSMLSGSTNPSLQKFGAALQGAAAGAKMGSAFGPWGAAIGAVGGAIMGFIGKGKKMRAEMKKIREAFEEAHGGADKLAEEAERAGVSLEDAFNADTPEEMKEAVEQVNEQLDAFNELLDLAGGELEDLEALAAQAGVNLDEIWDAKNPEDYLNAVEKVKQELDDWNNAQDELQTAMDKYGITIDQLGGKFRQQKFDEMGLDLLKSFELLKAAGVDVGVITEKMSEDMSDYVNRSVAAGTTIPLAMKPMVQQMIDAGQLFDENGDAITSMEDSGISFAQTMEEGIASAVDAINKLVAVLAKGFKIPVDVYESNPGNNPNTGGGGGGGGNPSPGNPNNYPEYAEGTRGFKDFGSGTPVMLHGKEAVVRPGDLSTVVNLSINENPMQTAETVQQMRKFTVDTVEQEVARSLSDAIEAGQA
jgi:hypothetical protein